MKEIKGIMPALVTPLKQDRTTLNASALKKLISYHKSLNADGFYIDGATGEGLALSMDTKKALMKTAVEEIGEQPLKIVHIADMNFENARYLAKYAEDAGADVISSIPPIYFGYDANEIYNYYKEIANAVKIPLMIYYNSASNTVLDTPLLKKLSEIDNITSIKWTIPNYYKVIELISETDMTVINGPDEMLLCGLAAGCKGGIGSTYNVMLPYYQQIYSLYQQGKMQEALAVQKKADAVVGIICKYGVIPSTKLLLEHMGFDVGDAHFPMKTYTAEEKKKIVAEMIAAGFEE